MTNTNDGSAQNALKEETSNPNNENSLALQNPSKEQELHSTHSFKWRWIDKNSTKITCNKVGTIENSLRRSEQFRKIAEKNKQKELVIIRDRKALSSHTPCTLIKKDDCLTVSFIKAIDKPKKPVGVSLPAIRNKPSCELVTFHVLAKGGPNIVKILRNPALKMTKVDEITVYAYKGETVKQALKRDGHFLSTIFKRNFALSHTSTEVKTELSNLVDDLDGETFQIILLNKSSPPNSQPGSLEEACLMPDAFPNEAPSRSDSENGKTQQKEPDLNGNMESEIKEKHSGKQFKIHLSLQFEEFLKGVKRVPKLSRIQNLLRVEFGQNAQMCNEVKTMKMLMELSDSVCQVRINGSPAGSGFLLFGSYVFTNGHVINDVYNENTRQLNGRVSVHFSYDSVEQTEGALDVEEVVCFEFVRNEPGKDWAFMRLSAKQTLPSGLLKNLGFHPEDGGICIIGHPEDGVKKIDPCLIVSPQNWRQVAEKHYFEHQEHVQFVASGFFENVSQAVQDKNVLTYESCFFEGSSGSPVFSKFGHVVAMHTGGYTYPTVKGKTLNVIEYAQSLPLIVVHLIIQMVERKRVDVLKEYLDCSYDQHSIIMRDIIMDGVKKLVESRNLTKFRESVNSLMETNDTCLRAFLEFFSQNPVLMETD